MLFFRPDRGARGADLQVGQLTIIFGALGVGIGIGLRDVVRNFVSRSDLMFRAPIQPGDVVDVAGMSGVVISVRATVIFTTFEGARVVVPNGMLLADRLVAGRCTARRHRHQRRHRLRRGPQRTIDLLVGIAQRQGISMSPAPGNQNPAVWRRVWLDFNLRLDHRPRRLADGAN